MANEDDETPIDKVFRSFTGYYEYVNTNRVPEKFIERDENDNLTDPLRKIRGEYERSNGNMDYIRLKSMFKPGFPDDYFVFLIYKVLNEHKKIKAVKVFDMLEKISELNLRFNRQDQESVLMAKYEQSWNDEVNKSLNDRSVLSLQNDLEFYRNIYTLYSLRNKDEFNRKLYDTKIKRVGKVKEKYKDIFDALQYVAKIVFGEENSFNPFSEFKLPTVDIGKEYILSQGYIYTPKLEGFSEITTLDMLTIFNRIKCNIKVPYAQLHVEGDEFYSKVYTGKDIESRPNYNYTSDPEKNEKETKNTMKIVVWIGADSGKNIRDAAKSSFKTITWKFLKNQISFMVTSDTTLEYMTSTLTNAIHGLNLTNVKEKNIRSEFTLIPSQYVDTPLKYVVQTFNELYNYFYIDEEKFTSLYESTDKLSMFYRLKGAEKRELRLTLTNSRLPKDEKFKLLGTGEEVEYLRNSKIVKMNIIKGPNTEMVYEFSIMFILTYYFYSLVLEMNPSIIENLESEVVVAKAKTGKMGQDLAQLMAKAPDLFVAHYSGLCQSWKPTIIAEDEVEDYENDGYKVLKFPRRDSEGNETGEFYYFICNHEKHIYPYVLKAITGTRELSNINVYKWTVCCGINRQSKKSGDYKMFKANILPNNATMKGTGRGINKIASNNSLLDINTPLSNLLGNYTSLKPGVFKRYGVVMDTSSFIHCVLIAINDPLYIDTLEQDDLPGVFVDLLRKSLVVKPSKRDEDIHMIQTYFDENDMDHDLYKYLINVNKKVRLECCKQETYDYKKSNIIDDIKNEKKVFNPQLYYRLIEELYEINVYVFRMPEKGDDITVGELELPRYKTYHARPKNTRPTVLVLRSRLISNHFELLVELKEDENEDEFIKKIFPENMEELCHSLITSLQGTYTFNYDNILVNLYSQENYLDVIGLPPYSQYIDDNGKCQAINFSFDLDGKNNKLTLFVPPTQPLNLPQDTNFYYIDYNVLVNFLDKPSMVVYDSDDNLIGEWFEVYNLKKGLYIPVQPIDIEIKDIEPTFIHPLLRINQNKDITTNLTQRVHKMTKDINIIKEVVTWLLAMSDMYYIDFINTYLRIVPNDEQYTDTSTFYDLSGIEARYPEVSDITQALEFYQEIAPSLVYKNEIVMCNESFANSVAHILMEYYLLYKDEINKYIPNMYKSIFDFTPLNNVIFFTNKRRMIEWIKSNVENKIYDSYNPTLFINRVSPIIFMNNIGNIYFIQPVNTGSLKRALNISKTWKEEGINLGYNSNELKGDFPYIVYYIESGSNLLTISKIHGGPKNKEEEIDESKYLKVLLYDEKNYLFYSLLKFNEV